MRFELGLFWYQIKKVSFAALNFWSYSEDWGLLFCILTKSLVISLKLLVLCLVEARPKHTIVEANLDVTLECIHLAQCLPLIVIMSCVSNSAFNFFFPHQLNVKNWFEFFFFFAWKHAVLLECSVKWNGESFHQRIEKNSLFFYSYHWIVNPLVYNWSVKCFNCFFFFFFVKGK